MSRVGLIFLVCVLVSLVSSPTQALEIQNFRSGLVCETEVELSDANFPIGYICFDTETIYITGQGQCVWSGEEKHCTWYGFEFDYTGATGDEEIKCSMISSLPYNEGSPGGIHQENVTDVEWSYSLEPGDGHYYKPNYSVLNLKDEFETLSTSTTVCSLDGEILYEYRMTTVYPAMHFKDIETSVERFLKEMDEYRKAKELEKSGE